MQKVITDFGSDVPFNKISNKLKEHYGIEVPTSSAQKITEGHARQIKKNEDIYGKIPDAIGVESLVCEIDGTMVPIVDIDEGTVSDKRKTRKVRWKECRLALSRKKGETDSIFGGTLGTADDAGDQWFNCAIEAGLGKRTKIHCVGDGATWIADQVDRVFGKETGYLIDFYHLCDYLAPASKKCSENPTEWLNEQKTNMKEGKVNQVLQALLPFIEKPNVADKDAPVRCCHRYIRNRMDQFNYKNAIDNDLPIGSGEIESAHRYVIQHRIKISGAWWKIDNAENMLALRILRENNRWDNYWNSLMAA